MPRFRGWLVVFIALVFTMGVGSGLLLSAYLREAPQAPARAADPDQAAAVLTARLVSELKLDVNQERRIEAILAAQRQRSLEMRQRLRGRAGAELDDLLNEIEKILTPEQQNRFRPLAERVRARIAALGATTQR